MKYLFSMQFKFNHQLVLYHFPREYLVRKFWWLYGCKNLLQDSPRVLERKHLFDKRSKAQLLSFLLFFLFFLWLVYELSWYTIVTLCSGVRSSLGKRASLRTIVIWLFNASITLFSNTNNSFMFTMSLLTARRIGFHISVPSRSFYFFCITLCVLCK